VGAGLRVLVQILQTKLRAKRRGLREIVGFAIFPDGSRQKWKVENSKLAKPLRNLTQAFEKRMVVVCKKVDMQNGSAEEGPMAWTGPIRSGRRSRPCFWMVSILRLARSPALMLSC